METSLSPSRDLLKRYAEELLIRQKKSPRTVEAYVDVAGRLLHFNDGLEGLDDSALSGFLRGASKKLAPSSQALWVSGLRNFFLWLERTSEFPGTKLARHLERPRVAKTLTQVIDDDDVKLVVEHVRERPAPERLLFELLYGSGLRISEALNLRVENYDPEAGTLRVLGKGRRLRVVPLTEGAREILRASAVQRLTTPWGPEVTNVRRLRRWVEGWSKALPLSTRLHPHKLRHSIASHLLLRGAKLPQIQKLLGHSQLSTTERYTHLKIEDLMRIYDESLPKKLSKDKK